MKEKLQEYALFAEVISAIAVVVTLIFLVIGIQENTNATQAAAYQDLLGELNDANSTLINDAKLATLWSERKTRALEDMDDEDAIRLTYMNRVYFRTLDAAFFSFINGSLNATQWERFRSAGCLSYSVGNSIYTQLWSTTAASVSQEYVAYLEEDCQIPLAPNRLNDARIFNLTEVSPLSN